MVGADVGMAAVMVTAMLQCSMTWMRPKLRQSTLFTSWTQTSLPRRKQFVFFQLLDETGLTCWEKLRKGSFPRMPISSNLFAKLVTSICNLFPSLVFLIRRAFQHGPAFATLGVGEWIELAHHEEDKRNQSCFTFWATNYRYEWKGKETDSQHNADKGMLWHGRFQCNEESAPCKSRLQQWDFQNDLTATQQNLKTIFFPGQASSGDIVHGCTWPMLKLHMTLPYLLPQQIHALSVCMLSIASSSAAAKSSPTPMLGNDSSSSMPRNEGLGGPVQEGRGRFTGEGELQSMNVRGKRFNALKNCADFSCSTLAFISVDGRREGGWYVVDASAPKRDCWRTVMVRGMSSPRSSLPMSSCGQIASSWNLGGRQWPSGFRLYSWKMTFWSSASRSRGSLAGQVMKSTSPLSARASRQYTAASVKTMRCVLARIAFMSSGSSTPAKDGPIRSRKSLWEMMVLPFFRASLMMLSSTSALYGLLHAWRPAPWSNWAEE